MRDRWWGEAGLRALAWVVAVGATLLSISLHVLFTTHAGGLWRDEVNTVNVANLSSVPEVWRHIEFDSFPILWPLIVRSWSAFGGGDSLFRCLGLVVGVGGLALLWLNARAFKSSVPLLSIALIGFSPSIIRWGDSMRGYGFGILMITLTFGLIWRVIEAPTRANVAGAALAALAAVQSLYYNAVLLFALCTGGCAVALANRMWRRTAPVLLIGGVSALSLLPYLSVFERSKSWGPMFQYPDLWRGVRLDWFWTKLSEALNPTGAFVVWIWGGLVIAALGGGVLCVLASEKLRLTRDRRDLVLFSATAMVVGLAGYYLFLKRLQYLTQPWYYVALLAFVAVAIDGIVGALSCFAFARISRPVVAAVIVATAFLPATSVVRTRMTNLDVMATWLEQNAKAGDFLVVNPWYCGITFARYYRGGAPWMTIPTLDDHRYARVDVFLSHMRRSDQREPVRPVLERIAETLRSGRRVWLVGGVYVVQSHAQAPVLAPASDDNWHDGPYIKSWAMQVGYFLQNHAKRGLIVTDVPRVDSPVNHFENLPLLVVEGWRE